MDSDDSDSEEKKNTLPEIRSAADLAKKKARGKRPMEAKKQKQSKKDSPAIDEVELKRQSMKNSPIKDAVELITQKAKGITIKETATTAKRGMGGWRENVVISQYSLRSGDKVMDVDVASESQSTKAANKKRKGTARSSDVSQGLEADTEEVCKRLKGRKKDDDTEKDGAGAGGRITRASSRKRRARSF